MPASAPDDQTQPADSPPQLDLIAACAFGLEAVVSAELRALGYKCKTLQNGRVLFRTDASAICRANLWLRSADRVLLRLGAFPATDFGQLYDATRAIPWAEWLPADATFPVNGKSVRSRLSSVPACQKIVKKAIVDALAEAYGQEWHPETGAPFHVEVALLEDQVTLSLDTTGPSLHKRGYRTLNAEAQLKETLAAGLVWLSGWQPEQPLWDPFCGTGTIPIEAALWGRRMAPGLQRSFSAEQWPALPADGWRLAREEARDLALPGLPQRIVATDINPAALSLARCHAQQAGVTEDIHFEPRDFAAIGTRKTDGKLIGNPPYGERMGSEADVQALYRNLPAVMARLAGWSCYLLTSHPRFEQVAGMRADRRRKLYNGRLECWLYQFERQTERAAPADADAPMAEAPPGEEGDLQELAASSAGAALDLTGETGPASVRRRFPRGGGRPERMEAQQETFSQRLANRVRHLRKWPTRRGITCFRLYDRDVPEIPLTVDRYEDHLHVVEHERPHERTEEQHAEWLARMAEAAADVTGLDPEQVRVKSLADPRPPLYEGSFDPAGVMEAHEGGLKFYVSLRDFADTGLFLDERLLRKWVRDNAAGKRVLNLFAYTGATSVCAAAAGASRVATVDLFASHLTWARQNMALNGFLSEGGEPSSPALDFVAADGLSYLEESDEGPYDLAIVNPPASCDRSSSGEWDLARDHIALLQRLRTRLAPGGQVILLSRARRFKLAPDAWPSSGVREISQQTVPEDFRNERIHRCWRLTASPGERTTAGDLPTVVSGTAP